MNSPNCTILQGDALALTANSIKCVSLFGERFHLNAEVFWPSSRAGLVLDPFSGAGTSGLVALKLGRRFLGLELNQKYVEMAERRIRNEVGLLLEVKG